MNSVRLKVVLSVLFLVFITSCGGGGSSDGASDGGGAIDSAGGTGNSSLSGTWLASASVASDTCHERISNVQQRFHFGSGQVDTGIVVLAANDTGEGTTFAFSEQNGSCLRTYTGVFSNVGGGAATVNFTSQSVCPNLTCTSTWIGTASEVASADKLEDENVIMPLVNGEACNPNVPGDVGYRPSLFECNGNAAVLMHGNFRNNFSVVVRALGGANDRDPGNPTCGTNECSPYKTQKKLELPAVQVNCLGANGFSGFFARVTRISVKFVGLVTDPRNTSQFEQYCLPDRGVSVH